MKDSVQLIRLADVFLIAPFLMYAGSQKQLPRHLRFGLWTIGLATLAYNGYNYIQVARGSNLT